jgi:hypothetical protein
MNSEDIGLPPHLQRLVNYDINPLDIMHGELKNLMLIWEREYESAQAMEVATDYTEFELTLERKYAEGFLDALTALYKMTYELAFAIQERNERFEARG